MKANDLELTPGRFVGEGHPTFIIAEIGQNHQGKNIFFTYFIQAFQVE